MPETMEAKIKHSSTAPSAFNIAAVKRADMASARVVKVPYGCVEFDTKVSNCGLKIWVKIIYDGEGDIEVYRLNDDCLPVEPEILHWLSVKDAERLVGETEGHWEDVMEERRRNADAAYEMWVESQWKEERAKNGTSREETGIE